MKVRLSRAKTARRALLCLAFFLVSQPLLAQSQQQLNEFRRVLVDYAYTVENAQAVPYSNFGATEKILALSNEELKAFYGFMPDPEAFVRAAKTVIEQGLTAPAIDFQGALKSHPAAVGFSPDYPSGANYDAFIATLPGLGLLDFGKTNRTDADGVGGAWIAYHALTFTALAAQAVCDASLLAAPVACPIAGVANAAAMATQVVLDQTAYQDGLVDGAEIEAAYENTVILLGQQNDLAADLTTHDTDIKSALNTHDTDIKNVVSIHDTDIKTALSTHDTDIKALLANIQAGVDANGAKLDILLARQLEVIRLLHTPQGLRTSDVPACDGGPCSWNP